jgi:hypothetical protein
MIFPYELVPGKKKTLARLYQPEEMNLRFPGCMAYPFYPNPHARATSDNEFSDLTKGLMMFALTGLNDMEDVAEGKARLLKMQSALQPDALLKAYGLPTWEALTKDDGDDSDDEDDDDDSKDDESIDDSNSSSSGGGHYDPDEPRIPAGQPGGGQWTTAGNGVSSDSGSISADDVRTALREDFDNYNPSALPLGTQVADSGQTMTDASGADNSDSSKSRQVTYSDGTSVIDPNTGTPYPMPDGMDIAANVKAAENYDPDATDADKASSMIYWFSQGGPQDYQRPDGYIPALLFGDYVAMYRNVTNYNYGAVSAAMGYSLDETLTAAGLYNQMRGNTNLPDMNITYGIQNKAVNNITQGFQDYFDGKWTAKNK